MDFLTTLTAKPSQNHHPATMSYSNYKRFLVARFNEARRLIGDPDTIEDGTGILRDLLASRPSPGPWLRMKCHLGLSFYADDFFDAEVRRSVTQTRSAPLNDVS